MSRLWSHLGWGPRGEGLRGACPGGGCSVTPARVVASHPPSLSAPEPCRALPTKTAAGGGSGGHRLCWGPLPMHGGYPRLQIPQGYPALGLASEVHSRVGWTRAGPCRTHVVGERVVSFLAAGVTRCGRLCQQAPGGGEALTQEDPQGSRMFLDDTEVPVTGPRVWACPARSPDPQRRPRGGDGAETLSQFAGCLPVRPSQKWEARGVAGSPPAPPFLQHPLRLVWTLPSVPLTSWFRDREPSRNCWKNSPGAPEKRLRNGVRKKLRIGGRPQRCVPH